VGLEQNKTLEKVCIFQNQNQEKETKKKGI
jgi:hypothetical protein